MADPFSRARLQELAGDPYGEAAAAGSQYRPAERKPLTRSRLEELASYKPPGLGARALEEVAGLGRVAYSGAKFLALSEPGVFEGEPSGGPGTVVQEAVKGIGAKYREIQEPEEEKRARGAGALSPRMQRFERAAKLFGLPLEAIGIPVVSTGESLGRAAAGEPGAIGETVGLGAFAALGGRAAVGGARAIGARRAATRARGMRERGFQPTPGVSGVGAGRGVKPPPSAEPPPGTGPRGPGPKPGAPPRGAPAAEAPPAAGKAPAGRPQFFWEHEAVDPGSMGRGKAPGSVQFKTRKGKTVEVDAETFQNEVNRQGEYPRFEYQGKTVVDHKPDPGMKRHSVWFEDGTQTTIPHAEFLRASGGRFRQGAPAPEEGPIPPPPGAEAPPRAEAPPGAPPVEPRAPGTRTPGARPPGVAAVPPPEVTPPGVGPRPAPSARPGARVVRPRAGRAFAEFDPEVHSLSDAALRRGIAFGKGKPIPQMFREALKAGKGKKTMAGQFRNEQTGVPVDALLRDLIAEDRFPLAEDMPVEDLLNMIAADWAAKKTGGDRGRTWSSMRQFQEVPEGAIPEPPSAEGVRAMPEVPREEIVRRIDDAVSKGDPDAEYQWRERLAIMDEQAPLEPGALDFPPSEARPGGGMSPELTAALGEATAAVEGQRLPAPVTEAMGALSPAPAGHVRLWRWEGPGAVKAGAAGGVTGGNWFEISPGAYYSEGMGPEAGRYVDVTRAEFAEYASDPNATEIKLPPEIAGRAQPLTAGAPAGAGLPGAANVIPPPPGEVPSAAATQQGLLTPSEIRNAKLALRAKGHLFPPMQAVRNEALARRDAGLTGPPETDPVQPGQEGWIDLGDIIRSFRPKRRKPPPSTPEYDQILKDRELARAVAPWSQRLLEWATDLPTEFQRRIFNQDVRIHKLADEIERSTGRKIPAGQDPRVILDLVRGGTQGRMLWSTMKIAEARKAAAGDDLLVHRSKYLDLMGWRRAIQIIEERMATAFAKGDYQTVAELRQRIAAGEVAPQHHTTEKINEALEALKGSLDPADWELVQHHADNLWDIGRTGWDLGHDTGLLSDAVYQQGISRGKEYIPLNRLHQAFMDDPEWGGFSSLNAATRRSLQRLEGSTLSTMDPDMAMNTWMSRIIREAGKNEAMRVVHDLRNLAPKEFAPFVRDLPSPDARPPLGWSKITYRVNGDKVAFAMPEPIAQSLLAVGPQEIGILQGLAQIGRRALQMGAVSWNIAFAAPNIPRDIGRFWALSKASKPLNPAENVRLLKSLGQGLGHVIKQDPWYMQMLWHRAAGSTMGKQLYPEVWLETPWTKKFSNKVIHAIPELINITEEWSKMASFRKLREMGFSPEEAAHETRNYAGTPNWGMRGSDSPMLNLISMFFNVGMRGKAAALSRWQRMPARFFVTGIGMSLGALALYAWNAQFRDEDGEAEWIHVPPYDKKTNWVILTDQVNPETGRHAYFMIRKPEELQAIYNPIETGLWEVAGQTELETRDYYQMLIDSFSATIPFVPDIELSEGETVPHAIARNIGMGLNPVAQMPIEQAMGIDLYRNRPQVPRRLQDVDPRYQFTPRTSPTAVVAGQATGISPMRIEHGFRSLGGLGEQVLGLIDPIAERYSPQKPGLYRGAEETPVVGSVIRRVFRGGFNDQVLRDYEELFYSYYRDANEVVATVSELEGRDREEMWRYLIDDPKRMILRDRQPMLRQIASSLTDLRERRRDILSNPALSDLEKGERSRAILAMQMQLVEQQAMTMERMIEEAGKGTPPALVGTTGQAEEPRSGLPPPPR